MEIDILFATTDKIKAVGVTQCYTEMGANAILEKNYQQAML